MEDISATFGTLLQQRTIEDRPFDELNMGKTRKVVSVAAAEIVQHNHLRAQNAQGLHQVRPDESSATGNQGANSGEGTCVNLTPIDQRFIHGVHSFEVQTKD